jgi:hypothetical protein
MLFHFEIQDTHVDSIRQYLATQIRVENDPNTKAQRMVPMFPDGVEEFVEHQLTNLVESIVVQYPDDVTRAAMVQQQALKDSIRAATKPKRLTDDAVREKLAAKA